MKWEFRNEKK